MTLPPSDEENYDHKKLALWPVFGGAFIYYNFKENLDEKPKILLGFIGVLILL